MITMTQPSLFTALDHPDFKLNEQQEAIRVAMSFITASGLKEWFIAYDLIGKKSPISDGTIIVIGDAGRRMRELRAKGILESRKRGRYEEFRIIN